MPVLTAAVGVVMVPGSIVPTQPTQQQAVVHQPLDGLQQERVERQVADFLELELSVHCLQLLEAFGCIFQFCQDLVMPLEVAGKLLLRHKRAAFRFGDLGEGPVAHSLSVWMAFLVWVSVTSWTLHWGRTETNGPACVSWDFLASTEFVLPHLRRHPRQTSLQTGGQGLGHSHSPALTAGGLHVSGAEWTQGFPSTLQMKS